MSVDSEDRPHILLARSIRENDLQHICQLLDKHPDLREFQLHGGALHYAARLGQLEIVKYLIDEGFDVNKGDDLDGATPLRSACVGGHLEVARYLLDHGAIIDTSTPNRNPLFAVIIESVKEKMNKSWGPSTGEGPAIARLLFERGIDTRVSYSDKHWKDMDAVAFAKFRLADEMAEIIALWNANGDEAKAKEAVEEGMRVALRNNGQ